MNGCGNGMGKMSVNLPTDLAKQMSKLAGDEPKKRVVYAGAKVAADAIKKSTPIDTGDLADSVGITDITKDDKGNHSAKVGFGGYDSKGVANAVKANSIEAGTSKIPKRPFVRPATNQVRKQIQKAMKEETEKQIKEIFKE